MRLRERGDAAYGVRAESLPPARLKDGAGHGLAPRNRAAPASGPGMHSRPGHMPTHARTHAHTHPLTHSHLPGPIPAESAPQDRRRLAPRARAVGGRGLPGGAAMPTRLFARAARSAAGTVLPLRALARFSRSCGDLYIHIYSHSFESGSLGAG